MKKINEFFGNEKIPELKKLLRLMKLTICFILISVGCVFAGKTYSQTKMLTLHMENATVKEVLAEIEDQSEFRIMYSGKFVDVDREVSLEVKTQNIESVLNTLFAGTDVSYTIKDQFIVLITPELMYEGTLALAQQRPVSGKVTDSGGQPLPGVTVVIKGTTQGTVTNSNGNYSFSNIPDDATLVFSFVGMKSQEVVVGNQTNINITLEEDAIGIEEVVAVGYGIQRKSDVTGSITSFNMDKLEDAPEINVLKALQGAMPGISINIDGNSAEGNDNTILIRGKKSFAGGNDPLIILDGIPYSGSLSDINSNDIESVEVLKDASAAAIYGARAANGVILITTKKGERGRDVQVSYHGYYGIENVAKLPDMMTAETYYHRKLERFGSIEKAFTPSELEVWENGTMTDWVDIAQRVGSRQQHNLAVSGGGEKTSFYISGSYVQTKGIAVNDDYNRFNFRFNFDFDITDWLTYGSNTLLNYSERDGLSANWEWAFFMNPLSMAYNEDGTLKIYPWPDDTGFINPLEPTKYQNEDNTRSVISNNFFNIKLPIKGLSYKINTGYTFNSHLNQTYQDRQNTLNGFRYNGYATVIQSETEDWLIENILSYNKSFDKHNIFFTGLYSSQQDIYKSYSSTGYGFPSDIMTYYQPSSAEVFEGDANYLQSSHISQMLRLNYNYDSKYLLTLTARRDGFSAFGSDKKYGVFSSVALGWNVKHESFMQDVEWLSSLKLRLSYGQNGNEGINPYSTLARLEQLDYIDGSGNNLVGYYPGKLGNSNLGWETTSQINAGIDFAMFSNRIQGTIDVYSMKTHDLLLEKSIPSVNGVTSIILNTGETKGQGAELQLSSVNINKNDFSWTTNYAFDLYRNKIVNIGLFDDDGKPIDDLGSRRFIGHPIDVNYDYVFDGIWQLDEVDNYNLEDYMVLAAGDVKYKDVTGDGKITPDDRTIIGSITPNFSLGLTNYFSYKNINFSFSVYSVQGLTKFNPLYSGGFWGYRRRAYNFNYWTPENPTNEYQENTSDRTANPLDAGFYEDASFIRLRDVTLSYRFPDNLSRKMGIGSLEIYSNAKNLLTLTNWRGLDPEFTDQVNIPPSKIYLFGIKIGIQ